MPTYHFRHKKTGKVIEEWLSVSARDQFIQDNPDYEPFIDSAPELGDSVRLGIRKPDDGFREVLSKISKANYRSNLTNKLSRK